MNTSTSTANRGVSPPHRRIRAAAAALLAGFAAGAAGAAGAATDWPPPPAALSDADVRAAIEAIQHGLEEQRNPERGWDPARWTSSWGSQSQVGGYSALACLALIRTGASPHAEGLAEAITQVRLAELEGIYALATRVSLLAELPPSLRTGLEADVQRLLASLHLETGGWNYRIGETRARRDNSLRQFGALALWDAAAAGVAIPTEAWTIIDEAFIEAQRPDGGWNYTQNEEPSRGSMTAAAVATLMITDEQTPTRRRTAAAGPPNPRREAIDRGLRWLDRRFKADENPGSRAWFFYYAYSIERVGLAAGIVHLAGRDWFRELARAAIDRTCRRTDDGRIVLRRDRRTRVDDLAFTLLLLSRGRIPLLAGKLVLPEASTDERPRDVGRLARIAGEAMETDVGWRRVEVSDPLEDWLSVPVLALVGRGPLPDRETAAGVAFHARLGPFLDAGGWLMVVDEGDGRFGRDVADAIRTVRPRAAVDRADRDHPIFVFHRDTGRREPVRIVHDGVRDLAVLFRGDEWLASPPAAAGRRTGDPRRVDPHEATLLNLALAATADVPPGPRLAARPGDPRAAGRAVLRTPADREPGPAVPVALTLRRLRHGGHWDAVPGAESAFAAWAEATGMATVGVEDPVQPGESPPPARGPSLVLLTGTEAPSPAAAAELAATIRRVTEAGHRVLVVGCGRAGDAFSRPVERALGDAGAAPPRRPAATDLLLASPLPLPEVRWTAALAADLGPRPTAPRLRATRFGPDAAEILLSHEDVLLGLLGRGTWQVRGHAPDSARRLVLAAAWPGGRMPGADDDADDDAPDAPAAPAADPR